MHYIPKPQVFCLHAVAKDKPVSRAAFIGATFILCAALVLTTSFCGSPPSSHVSQPGVKGAASHNQQGTGSSVLLTAHTSPSNTKQSTVTATATTTTFSSSSRRINIPYFNNAVPFNQTAIFWFGTIDSSHVYADVRVGYNNSELYIDLRLVDRYLWYDPNKQAPDLNVGDNASVYLNVENHGTPAPTSYQFQTAVSGYQLSNTYQKAYTSTGGGAWTAANVPFTRDYWWRASGFNGAEGAGWSSTYHLPFSSLGLTQAPSQGTVWKLAVRLHNRDDAANTPLADTWWPEAGNGANPSGWGDLMFGLAQYTPPQTNNIQLYTVRNGLNNQVVTDGMVGGSLDCGSYLGGMPARWQQWGSATYPGAIHFNIMNEADMSDWDCFSKFYVTFPLSSLPTGKGIVNATVTLFEYANAGVQGQPNPSYIQAAVVNDDWNPATLAWNNAPLVQENIGSILVNTKSQPVIPPPGLAATWDVSVAVAQAYRTGQPLRLVFYDTDNQYNSGKYFWSSYVGPWNTQGRPTLQVKLGQ